MTTKMMSALILLALSTLSMTSSNVMRGRGESSENREQVTALASSTWRGPYFSWLTKEQKSELDDIVGSIASQDENAQIKDMLAKTLEFYNDASDAYAVKATSKLQMFCKSKMTTFFGPEEMGELQKLRNAGVPKEQLFAKFNDFVLELADREDRVQVRLYAAFCKKIYKLG